MQKFKSKKGFTLAELLIVVAIIAVLTAIAVPLFVGSLNKAEENVKNANIRAVRSVAVVYILSSEPTVDTSVSEKVTYKADGIYGTDGKMQSTIWVETTVDKTGTVGKLDFKKADPKWTADSATKITDGDNKGGYTVRVIITQNEIEQQV